jgi:hypothetical protein
MPVMLKEKHFTEKRMLMLPEEFWALLEQNGY